MKHFRIALSFNVCLALVILCTSGVSALHGLGGEGYSVWTGDEHKHDHNHEGSHSHSQGAHSHKHEHVHTHSTGGSHDHEHVHTHSKGGSHKHEHVHTHSNGGSHKHEHVHTHSNGGSHKHEHIHEHEHVHTGAHSHGHKTLEELEAEEMATYGFSAAKPEEDYQPLSTWERIGAQLGSSSWGTWTMAMGSSLAVSLCSLICLIILPFILREGQTPSEGVVRVLTGFGAGAMVGDAFLHQLPHAFSSGGAHSHGGHDHGGHSHDHEGHGHESGGHAHSIQDLSIGLAVLVGLVVFFLVEKAVRYVEEVTTKNPEIAKQISFQKQHNHKHGKGGHSHHEEPEEAVDGCEYEVLEKEKVLKEEKTELKDNDKSEVKEKDKSESDGAKKRKTSKKTASKQEESVKSGVAEGTKTKDKALEKKPAVAPGSLLVLGYLNLFSDGVHNFTDGMALGAAFVHHGAVGGWSRTLFMLAHELPQEVGDFGILVRAGFSVTKALALNFLSASMAMAGTALALIVGGDASNSSIIEGFTAGGFVYIAVAGVMPDLHAQGTGAWITTQQVLSMLAGMGVALAISLWE